jgi:asparagine synthase (glutamine-hydrolysing)
MALALKEEGWYQLDLHHDQDFGLGRVSLGISNPEPQPIWNEDETLAIVMEGEIYDYQDLKQYLMARGHRFQMNNDVEFVLHLYEEFGEDFAIKLNGAFVVAIWDRRAKKLLLANDRIGLHPLYYAQCGGDFLFASGVRALLADPKLPRRIDRLAIAQLLTFDHVLGDRTLLGEVRLLPPASLLTIRNRQLTIGPYWTLRYPDVYQQRSEEDYLEDLIHHLRQAVARQAPGDLPAGVLLSGGLDSRVIAALLCDDPPTSSLHTFTFGIPGCDDARFARDVAARLGVQHHFFELKPDYLLEMAEKGVRLTDGLENCVHMHALATLPAEAEYAKVFYKGFMGDALMGYAIDRQFWANYDQETQYQVQFQTHVDQGLTLFSQAEQKDLFSDEFHSCVDGAVFDSYRVAMAESKTSMLADQRIHFDLRQRVPRMTLHGVELVRSRGVVRTPYCDNDLVDFTLAMPPGLRFERYLIKKALIRAFPDLAKIPVTETGYPMMPCLRSSLMLINRQIRWRLRMAGLKWVPITTPRPYADYHSSFRTVLRDWVEDTLLNNRSLLRGYFRPSYVQQLVSEQMEGTDHAGKLGALLTLELWHRQFVD